MKWEVQVAGPKVDLDDLCKVFESDALRLENRSTGYFLTASEFESFTDHRQVEARASELVGLLSGASRLSLSSREALKMSGATRIDENGQRHVYMSLSATLHVSARATLEVQHADGTVSRTLPASSAPAWLALARSDSAVAKALRLFGTGGESWVDLYRILEVISHDVGGDKALAQRGWVTKSKLETFQRTANSVGAIGDDARHGTERTQPPKDPMSHGEAKSLVSVLLHSWLQEKAQAASSA